MVVDAALFLWSKAKSMFQKHQSGSSENPKYLQKMENPNKVNSSFILWSYQLVYMYVFSYFIDISKVVTSIYICFVCILSFSSLIVWLCLSRFSDTFVYYGAPPPVCLSVCGYSGSTSWTWYTRSCVGVGSAAWTPPSPRRSSSGSPLCLRAAPTWTKVNPRSISYCITLILQPCHNGMG